MAETSGRKCDNDGRPISSNPELGDRQGGHHKIGFPAYTIELDLCERCIDTLTLNQIRNLRFREGVVTHYRHTGESLTESRSKLPIFETGYDG